MISPAASAIAAFGFAAVSLSSCLPEEGTGYVEIKRLYAPISTRDVYKLNGEEIAGLRTLEANLTLVLKAKTGPAKLELFREDQHWLLCKFDLGRNRIVTATISLQGRDIRCTVQS